MSYVELMRAGSLRPFADFVGVMFTFNAGMHAYVSALPVCAHVPWCPTLAVLRSNPDTIVSCRYLHGTLHGYEWVAPWSTRETKESHDH